MDWKPRLAVGALTVGAAGALLGGPIPSVALLLLGLGLLWSVPGWWRAILYGVVGGLATGIVVLGAGFRLAMRVVAILDPARQAEFTLEGTLFLIVIFGGFTGTTFGALGSLARTGWSINSAAAWAIPASFVMLLLFAVEEFRTELFTLGAGPWVNVPMFAALAAAYGWAAMGIAARLEHRRAAKLVSAGQLEVTA